MDNSSPLAAQRKRHANHLRQQARGRPNNRDSHSPHKVRALCDLFGTCDDNGSDKGSSKGKGGSDDDNTSKSSSSSKGGADGGSNGRGGDDDDSKAGSTDKPGASGKGNSDKDDNPLAGLLPGSGKGNNDDPTTKHAAAPAPATTKQPARPDPEPKSTTIVKAPPAPPTSSSVKPLPKVTITSTSSSSIPSSSSLVPTTTSEPLLTTQLPVTTPNIYTSYAYVTQSALPASSSPTTSSDGPGAGPIIGIVAGSLAGVVILTVIIGFVVKKMRNKPDPYEANPFDRDAFHRHSTMLPDYDDEDLDGGAPSMTEHHNMGGGGGGYDAAALAAVGGVVGGVASHHDNGPRPPTMFQKHINGPAAQYGNQQQYHNDGMYVDHDGYPTPQLPPMAFGAAAGDPYGHQMSAANVANPYAHLDRGGSQRSQGDAHHMYNNGYPVHEQPPLDRSFSQGSQQSRGQWASPHDSYDHGEAHEQHDTAGRPGTAEGRSGTPDLPNVQQTYAAQDHQAAGMYDNAPQHQEHYHADEVSPGASETNNSTLSVRNLLPTGATNGQRPLSAVSSNADPEDAYGGVY